jgi:hypothetical protein
VVQSAIIDDRGVAMPDGTLEAIRKACQHGDAQPQGYWRMSANRIVQQSLTYRHLEEQGVPNLRTL